MATVSKSRFAEIIGVTPGRVSQMIREGLPVEGNGKIDVARGRIWYADNIDGRTRSRDDLFDAASKAKAGRDFHDMRIRKMKADEMAGTLVDKATAERVIFGRARAEREAWLDWPRDVSPRIAAELGVDETVLLSLLSRMIRDHLEELAGRSYADIRV